MKMCLIIVIADRRENINGNKTTIKQTGNERHDALSEECPVDVQKIKKNYERPQVFLFTRFQIKRGNDVLFGGDDNLLRRGHRVEASEFNFPNVILPPETFRECD